MCRQLQSKLPHPALPLTRTLTCWDHPLAPATTLSTFLPSEHRQLAEMPKYLCVKIYTRTVRSLTFSVGQQPRPPNALGSLESTDESSHLVHVLCPCEQVTF